MSGDTVQAKDERYYGLKGHVMINLDGYVTACPVTPANVDERELLADCTEKARGLLIGDKGWTCFGRVESHFS